MKANILWIEGKKASNTAYHTALRRQGHQTEVVTTIKKATDYINTHRPDLTIVHLPSLRLDNSQILQNISTSLNGNPFILISSQENVEKYTQSGYLVFALPLPVKNFRVAIKSLLPAKVEAGAFLLDLDKNTLMFKEREIRLTPRMARLFSVLMRHVGEVVERKDLFITVWNTNFTGDTRSLDVHISWLRKAIEPNPSDPQHIITLRGLGYRLDI